MFFNHFYDDSINMVPLNLIIFLWKVISYSLPIPLMFITYKKYRHWSHFGLGLASFLFLISSVNAFIIEEFANQNVITIGWMGANIFLYCGFWIIILSLAIAQFDKLPSYSHLITILVGVLIGLILNPDNVQIYRESGSISASYSLSINVCGGLLFMVFIITAFTPLIKKLLSKKVELKKKQYFILLISYLLFSFWVISLFLTRFDFLRETRRYTLSLGMFLWAIALYIDPLTIVISNAKIQKAVILTKGGLPIFSYDFEEDREMEDTSGLLAGLLSAVKSGMEKILTSGKSLKTMAFEDSIMTFINAKYVIFVLVSQQTVSSNTQLIANVFLEAFETKYQHLLKEDMVEKEEMNDIVDLLREVIDSVQL